MQMNYKVHVKNIQLAKTSAYGYDTQLGLYCLTVQMLCAAQAALSIEPLFYILAL